MSERPTPETDAAEIAYNQLKAVAASSGYLDRIVRLFRAVWKDVGMTPADAARDAGAKTL